MRKNARTLQGLFDQVREFWAARAVLTAIELDLFSALAQLHEGDEHWPQAEAIAARIHASPRGTALLLDSLAALGLVLKSGPGYRNADLADRHLVAGRPEDRRGALEHSVDLWARWSHLTECVRTGRPAPREETGEDGTRRLAWAMHHGKLDSAKAISQSFPLEGIRRALDLGGGSGVFAQAMAERSPSLSVVLLDRPAALEVARSVLPGALLESGRITLRAGDFLHDPIGEGYDLVLLSSIVHMLSPVEVRGLLRVAWEGLAPGGLVLVRDFLLDEDGCGPRFASLFSLNMLVNTPGGRSYRERELAAWLEAAGFHHIHRIDVVDDAAGLLVGAR